MLDEVVLAEIKERFQSFGVTMPERNSRQAMVIEDAVVLPNPNGTAPGMFIANTLDEQPPAMPIAPMTPPQRGGNTPPPPAHNGMAYWIKVSAEQDGSFTVVNSRNGFSKRYGVEK